MKKIRKALSLLLVLCMVSGMSVSAYAEEPNAEENETGTVVTEEDKNVPSEITENEDDVSLEEEETNDIDTSVKETTEVAPVNVEATRAARDASGDDFYKIVHVDAGRKYFSPENLKKIIDNAAEAGFNQVELYLSDNQGFRFALDDMNVTTSTGNTYNLTLALGDGYNDGSKYTDGSGKYLTQSEMTDIISYANKKGIDIVPCINVPGHMGAILEAFPQFKYQTSKSSIDLENAEAVAFALAITEKYAAYFESQGVKFYNLGADEYANDMSTMGFEGLYKSGKYAKFVEFLNNAAIIVKNHGMTPRAFNDGICYKDDTSYNIDKDIQVCYWSNGWGGYNVASAATLNNAGYKLINTHGDYYWVLGNSGWQCSTEKAREFDYKTFQGGTIDNPAGAMFCIWCDVGSADGQDNGTAVVSKTADVIKAFGATLPGAETPSPEENTVTCETGTVSVTAAGLTGLTCAETTAPTMEGAAEGKIKAYDVTPQTADGAYVGEGKVSIAVPEGWDTSKLGAFIVTDGVVEKLTGSYANGRYIFTAPHFSTMGIYEKASNAPVEVTENKTITLMVGQTTTDTISGANYAGDYTTEDPAIATVTVTGKDGTESTINYTKASVTCNTLISDDSDSWTAASGYYYKADDGNYYPVYAKRSSSGFLVWYTYYYTWGYSTTSSTNNVTQIGNKTQETESTSTEPNITVYTKPSTEGTPASTTVTFTGHKAGTTYVTIGNTRYTINVNAEDLSKVTPLTVEFWITNRQVTANGATNMTINASDVYSENGTLFSSLVPATGTYDKNIMVFWKGTRLDSDNKQTGNSEDKTNLGTDFTYIRYWEGSWAYSADGELWTNVVANDQIVAYYLQKTEVTDEVTTEVVDWGVVPSTSYNSSNYVLVDFAVKYESGERTPNSFPVNGKTMAFHCDPNDRNTVHQYSGSSTSWSNYYRDIGMIKAEETADYEVYMITLTPTSDDRGTYVAGNANNATSYTYDGTEKVVWVDDEANLGDFADESSHFTSISGDITYSVGGEPIVPGLEIFNRHGMLVTYYVRAKVTEDSLAVHYIDQTANQEFYNYNIAVQGGTVFDAKIGLANSWKGNLANGTVTNLQNNTQTVSADLSTMPAIGAQYRYSDYTCIEVTRSEDGKDVYLYYTFNNAHSFVVDFGLPLNITANDLNISGSWTSASIKGAKYGTTSVLDGGVTYTPTKTFEGVETLQLTLSDNGGTDSVTHQIYIYPATTVYYEEGFATLTGFTGGSKGTETQATEAVGGKVNNYGYDPNTGLNQVGASNQTQAVSTAYGDKAEFTFTGTGVDIYTNSDPKTGTLFVQVKNAEGNTVKMVQVKTALLDGKSEFTQGQEVTGYNVPVVSLDLKTRGTYTVIISHVKSNADATGDKVNLDGFRVYGTLDGNTEAYQKDGEANPTFVELRDKVLTGLHVDVESGVYADQIKGDALAQVYSTAGGTNGAIIFDSIDGHTTQDVQDLLDNGPKNELYLRPGQSVVFKPNKPNAQIGLKALNASVNYSFNNGTKQSLNASTDMFYPVSPANNGTITITNNSEDENAILAITKVKFPETASNGVSLMSLTEDDLIPALMSLGFEMEATMADATANVNLVDYTGKVLATTALTATGEEGTETVIAGADIKAAAEQLLPEGYAFVDESAINDQTVICGESKDVNVQIGKVAVLKVTYKTVLGRKVGTATLTAVQKSSASSYTFSASELRKAAPGGYWTGTLIPTKVKYGSTGTRTVIGF